MDNIAIVPDNRQHNCSSHNGQHSYNYRQQTANVAVCVPVCVRYREVSYSSRNGRQNAVCASLGALLTSHAAQLKEQLQPETEQQPCAAQKVPRVCVLSHLGRKTTK